MRKIRDEWVSTAEAARLLSARNGRPISHAYVRNLAHIGKIRSRPYDPRTPEFFRADVVDRVIIAKPRKIKEKAEVSWKNQ